MQRLQVSGVVRLIYRSLGVKGLKLSIREAECEGTNSDVSYLTPIRIAKVLQRQ